MRRLIARAVLAIAVFLTGCDDGSSGSDEGGAKVADLGLQVVAASSGQAIAYIHKLEGRPSSAQPLEPGEGKAFWVLAAPSPGAPAAEPVKLEPQGLEEEFLFQFSRLEDAFPIYAAKLDQAPDNRYYLAHNTNGSSEGASEISIPQRFQIIAPFAHETVSLANDLVVKWDVQEAIDQVRLNATILCGGRPDEDAWVDHVVDNTGTYTISGGSFGEGPVIEDTCPLAIEVAVGREGIPGQDFPRSEVMGFRTDTVTLTAVE